MAPESEKSLTLGITGATGCIGRKLIRQLAHAPGVTIRALVRRGPGPRASNVHLIQGDLFAMDPLRQLVQGSDAVIHLAARNPTSLADDARDAPSFFAVNALGTATVAHLATDSGIPLLYASSVAVYDLSARVAGDFGEDEPLPEREATKAWVASAQAFFSDQLEDWAEGTGGNLYDATAEFLADSPPPAGENAYALSKFLGERWAVRTPGSFILRLSDVYGPGHESRGLLHEYLAKFLNEEEIIVDFGPRNLVSFVYMRDVLQGLLAAIKTSPRPEERILNVAHPKAVGPRGLADKFTELGHRLERPTRVRARKIGTKAARSFVTRRSERRLGVRWTPLRKGLKETVQYLQRPSPQRRLHTFPEVGL